MEERRGRMDWEAEGGDRRRQLVSGRFSRCEGGRTQLSRATVFCYFFYSILLVRRTALPWWWQLSMPYMVCVLSLSSTNLPYCCFPRDCITLRHSTDSWSVMFFERMLAYLGSGFYCTYNTQHSIVLYLFLKWVLHAIYITSTSALACSSKLLL